MIEGLEKTEVAAHAYADPVFFCKAFLPSLFSKDIPWVHRGLMAILTRQSKFLLEYGECDKIRANFITTQADGSTLSIFNEDMTMNLGRYTLVMLPRGLAKTTIAGIAMPLRDILFQDITFGAYVSNAAPHAKMQLNNIKREISDNEILKWVFGDIRPSLSDDEKWSEEMFETTTGCAFAARGRGGQIRGLNHKGQRPSKIICDDLEDMESVATDEQREKTRRWAYGDLIPALPELDPLATITVLGTMLHQDCLLETFAADPMWTTIRMGACDVDGEPLWEENLSLEKLEQKKTSFTAAGELHVFYMEYYNTSTSAETQIFKKDYFIHARPAETDTLRAAIYIDPAISEKAKADRTVITVCQQNQKGEIFVVDQWIKRGASEREKIDNYFRLSKLYECILHGVESIAYQAALVHLLKEEMFRKGQYFEVIPVTHSNKEKKIQRIKKILQPRYAAGYIKHVKRFLELEKELLDIPGGKHDDCPDSLAGCVALLDPWAAAASGDKDLAADEYEPLDDDWRLA